MKKEELNKTELNNVIILSKKLLKILYVVFIIGIVLGSVVILRELKVPSILGEILGVLSSLFIGFIFAWLFRPVVKKLNQKLPNALSSLLMFVLVIFVIVIFVYVFIPLLYGEVNELASKIPGIISTTNEGFINTMDKINIEGFDLSSVTKKTIESVNTFLTDFTASLPNTIFNLLLSLFSGIGTFFMGLIIGLYLLMDYENVGLHFQKLLPKKYRKEIVELFESLGMEARKCVNGTLTVAFMVFLCDSIGFALVGLDAPVLFGLFCGITDLIPYIGPYIGGAAAVVVALTSNTFTGVAVLIICIVVQILENYVLQPVVMSKASNLHPVVIIIGLLIFGHFFGILGMILATPCIAMLNVLVKFTFEKINGIKK